LGYDKKTLNYILDLDLKKATLAKKNFKLGLLGLGKVGLNVLTQNAKQALFNICWIADSKNFLSRPDLSPFSANEQIRIARSKQKIQGNEQEQITKIPRLEINKIKDTRDEAVIIKEKIRNDPKQWIILDASSTKLEVEIQVVESVLGCLAYCTCNKTVWSDYESCSKFYDDSLKTQTLLGLNCTTGVWVNQMDILPIVAKAYRGGKLKISKRDNSSFNLFFDSIEKLNSVERAISKLERGGYLEPGAVGLVTEADDQFRKARISANIIGKLMGIQPTCEDESDQSLGKAGSPKSKDAADIAIWHNSARKEKKIMYSALVTRMQLEGKKLVCKMDFEKLPRGYPLAKNFPGENVILLEAASKNRFEWSTNKKRRRKGTARDHYFLHSGRGGAVQTAAKLLKEAELMRSLTDTIGEGITSPIPILHALNLHMPFAIRLENTIASRLD